MAKDSTMDRRTFLEVGATAASLALGVSAFGCDSDDSSNGADMASNDTAMDQGQDVATDTQTDTIPTDTVVDTATDTGPEDTEPPLPDMFTFALSDYPELGDAGGMAQFEDDETGFRDRVFVVNDATEGLIAVSSRCTHRGCEVNARSTNFLCPCHDSQFEFNGDLKLGPATRALDRFMLESDGTEVTITEVVV